MIFHSDKLSAILMKARTSKGFSQTYMAEQLRISQKAYSYLESGHCKLDLTRLLKIADLTKTHPMHFVEKIIEGTPSWEDIELKEIALTKEVEQLEKQVGFLKSEISFLRLTIDKLLDKDK
jgi:transcriptional regulator with XRE-family HTH domain